MADRFRNHNFLIKFPATPRLSSVRSGSSSSRDEASPRKRVLCRVGLTAAAFGDFLVKFGDFLIKFGDFLIKFGDFLIKFGDFLIKFGDFLIKFGDSTCGHSLATTSIELPPMMTEISELAAKHGDKVPSNSRNRNQGDQEVATN